MRILSFGAHPDDIEFGCGATERKYIEEGHEAFHAVLTSGEAGSRIIASSELAQIREEEARKSAAVLGAQGIHFFRFADGFTEITSAMKIEVINHLRRVRPDMVFVHSSTDGFPDHQRVHRLVMESIAGAAGPWFQSSEGEPHRVAHILGYEVWEPMNRFQIAVDVTAQMPFKMEALGCHRSQTETVDYRSAVQGLARYRGVMSFRGTYGEVFEVLRSETP